MSKFFAASSSDSDSDSSDTFSNSQLSSSSSSSKASIVSVAKGTRRNKWLKTEKGGNDSSSSSSDDDDDDQRGIIKSAFEKRLDELRSYSKSMLDGVRVRDWIKAQNEFDKIQRGLALPILQREPVPRFYIRALVDIDNLLNIALKDKDGIKKMNPSTAKSLNTMKQRLKKENKTREAEIENFKEVREMLSLRFKFPVDELDSADERDELAEQAAAAIASGSKKATLMDPNDADGFVEVGKDGKTVTTIIAVNVFEKLEQVLDARGKKNTDKLGQIEVLNELVMQVKSPFQHICVLNALVATRFDYVPPVSGCMATDMWHHALSEIKQLYDFLDEYPNITIAVGAEFEEEEEGASKEKRAAAGEEVVVNGNVAAFIDRLDDEFFKSLQGMDSSTTEYIARLRDETALYALMVRAQKYSVSKGADRDTLDLMLMRRVEHLYYKPDSIIQTIEDAVRKEYPQLIPQLESPKNLVSRLCTILYKTNIDRIRTRALLCQVYHLALRDQFHEARNTILMSHLQETISQTDVATQTLFNRTLVQIGLCAFRCGFFRDAHNILQEISSSGKTKELLAQGISMQKYVERTPEQEKLDKSRQLPFHMHVNLELLECAYLVSAMLLEIPNMALHTHDSRRKMISKQFRRMLEYSERQVFMGPPENSRDHIMAASKSMAAGNWEEATSYISAIKIWDLLLNHKESIKEMLTRAIQEESLRTYIFTYAQFHESLGIESLSSMFSLPKSKVKIIIYSMIYDNQLDAGLDALDDYVVFNQNSTDTNSRIDYLMGYFVDKSAIFADATDKLVEAKNLANGISEPNQKRGGHRKPLIGK